MRLPRISIVIPAYNAGSFLSQTLASAMALDYPSHLLELIVVDDGSADDTVEVAQDRIRGCSIETRIIRQANAGPANARNTGWRQARGEWIQFLDADDALAPQKLAVQVADGIAEEASIACLYSPWQRQVGNVDPRATGPAGVGLETCTPSVDGDTILQLLRTENFIPLGSALLSRAWLDRVSGFNDAYRFIEDVDLFLRLAIAGGHFRNVRCDHPLFTYRFRKESLSRSSRSEFAQGCVRNAVLAESYWRSAAGTLSEAQVKALLAVYEEALRQFSVCDLEAFRSTWRAILQIVPGFRPSSSKVRLLSGVIGARQAYRLAANIHALRLRLA